VKGGIGSSTQLVDLAARERGALEAALESAEFGRRIVQREKSHQKWEATPVEERCQRFEASLDALAPGGRNADKGYAPRLFKQLRKNLLRERNRIR